MIKVAFASKEGIYLNEHFGWCKKFFIYLVDENTYTFLYEKDASKEYDNEAQKLEYKIESLDSSDIVYVAKIGPKASSLLKQAGSFAIRTKDENEKIDELIQTLQKLMQINTPLWLKRILLK